MTETTTIRGQGLNVSTRFKWCQQPDGLYTVFDVPIFEPTKVGEHNLTLDKMRQWVKNYQDRASDDYYGAIHIGHHQPGGVENREHAGFLDFLKIKGKRLFSDLVNIPGHIFQRIKTGGLPYRSAEIHPPFDNIDTLALLSSRKPHFTLPLLLLQEEPSPLLFQERRSALLLDEEKKDKKTLDPEEMIEAQDAPPQIDAPPEQPPQAPPMQPEGPPQWANGIMSDLGSVKQMMTQICQELGIGGQDQQPQAPPAQNPAPVAMQADQYVGLESLRDDYQKLSSELKIRAKLAEMKNAGIDSSALEERALQFADESESAAMMFLNDMENLIPGKPQRHPATAKAFELFQQDTSIEWPEKHADVAKLAFQTWHDTMRDGTEQQKKRLLMLADAPEALVKRAITLEEFSSGSFQKTIEGR